MSYNISLPKVTATSTSEQIKELQSYVYQMVGELNWALNTIDTSSSDGKAAYNNLGGVIQDLESITEKKDGESALELFNKIKALIIKSADIVNAYEEKMKVTFDGYYVADSNYGTFKETTSSYIEMSNQKLGVGFSKVESIENSLTKADGTLIQVESAINASANALTTTFDSKVDTLGETVEANHSELTQTAEGLQLQINSINREIDGSMYVYNVTAEPTLLNYPAWDFTKNIPCNNTVKVSDSLKFEYTDESYREHLRDIAFYEDEGLTYRFSLQDGVFTWMPVSDTEFGIAMQRIAELEVTAENLRSDFTATDAIVTSHGTQISTNTSNITQNASSISTEVTNRTNADNTLSSRISQTAKGIELTVGDQNDRTIGISIGVTREDGTSYSKSGNIVLNGNVVFKSNLENAGETSINGGNIKTNTISASAIKTAELVVGENISMGENAEISWSKVTDKSGVVTDDNKATKIGNNFIKTLNLEVGDEIKMGENAEISWAKVTNKSGVVTDDNKTTKIGNTYIQSLNLKVGNEIEMGDNATIKWSKVTDKDDVITDSNKSTKITKDYIESLNIIAENISGTNIDGKTITGGTVSGATITSSGGGYSTTIANGTLKTTSGGNGNTVEISGQGIDSWNLMGSTKYYPTYAEFSNITVDNKTSVSASGVSGTKSLLLNAPTISAPALIQSGSLSVGSTPQSVRFSQAFASIPNVVATFSTNSNTNPSGANGTIRIFQKTTSGFVIQAPSCTTAQNVCWIATV